MDTKEYNEKADEIEAEYQKKIREIRKEYLKDFEKKYFKNKDHLIVLDEKDNHGELVGYYFETKEEYPTFVDTDFWQLNFKTEDEFIKAFDGEQGGGTPIQITKEEFVKTIMGRIGDIVRG